MGGTGSGRWEGHQKKTTTEKCYMVNVNKLKGALSEAASSGPDGDHSGTLTMVRINDASVRRISYVIECPEGAGLVVRITHIRDTGVLREEVDQRVELVTSEPNFGGVRWYFWCPLTVNGEPCNRRAEKLYLPPNRKLFGCRHCYGLTYKSSQQSHRFDSVVKMITPDAPDCARELLKQAFLERAREFRRRRENKKSLVEMVDETFEKSLATYHRNGPENERGAAHDLP